MELSLYQPLETKFREKGQLDYKRHLFNILKTTNQDFTIMKTLLILNDVRAYSLRCLVVDTTFKFIKNKPYLLKYPSFYQCVYFHLIHLINQKYSKEITHMLQNHRIEIFETLKHQCIRVLIKNKTHVNKIPTNLKWIAKGEYECYIKKIFGKDAITSLASGNFKNNQMDEFH